MTELLLKRDGAALRPATRLDAELIEQLPAKALLAASIHQPRSAPRHRALFALAHAVFENQEQFASFERFRAYITVRAGHGWSFEAPPHWITPQGLAVLKARSPHVFGEVTETGLIRLMGPKSWAWDQMPEAEFRDLFDRACDVFTAEFGFDVAAHQKMHETVPA